MGVGSPLKVYHPSMKVFVLTAANYLFSSTLEGVSCQRVNPQVSGKGHPQHSSPPG